MDDVDCVSADAAPRRRDLRASRARHSQHRLDRGRACAARRLPLRRRRFIGSRGADREHGLDLQPDWGHLTGILIILLGLGLWRALSPDVLGRIGAGAVMLTGLTAFLEGFLRLDCRGIDGGCTNDSWHSSAHKMNNRFTVAATIAGPLILAFAFRRLP